jgi:hypothetical protein
MKSVAVFFGGRSVEHDISLITGVMTANSIERDKFNAIPIFVDKDGKWYTGESLFDLDEYKNFNFKDVVQVEYSSYEHYGYSPRYNYVSHNKVDIDIIVSKFYSPIVINDDSSFYGGNYESFKLISSNGESVKIEFYYKYLKNEEYQVFYSFDNLKTYDSIYYNFGMMNKIKLIENGIDSTSKTLNFSYIPFKEIDRTENIFPILLTESFGAEYECLEAYDETTFSLKTKFGTKYYQLMDHTFSELIS